MNTYYLPSLLRHCQKENIAYSIFLEFILRYRILNFGAYFAIQFTCGYAVKKAIKTLDVF